MAKNKKKGKIGIISVKAISKGLRYAYLDTGKYVS